MKKYQNKKYKFRMTFPDDWQTPGLLPRLFCGNNPQFFGPNSSVLRFSIGSLPDEPYFQDQQKNLENIAMKYGHDVLSTGSLEVFGKKHATMICRIPLPPLVNRRALSNANITLYLKNYSLMFNGFEYFATADLEKLPPQEYDSIIKTFEPL